MKTFLTVIGTLLIVSPILFVVRKTTGAGKLLAVCDVKDNSALEELFKPGNTVNCKYITWIP